QEGDQQMVALLGANGAGKSTSLKAISGLLYTELGMVTDGSIEFDGVRIDGHSPEDIVEMGIALVMEGRPCFEQLTVEENLRVGAYCRSSGAAEMRKDLELVYSHFPVLRQLRNKTSGYLSGGERQMLVIGRALMARPKLMLLDEPSLGLSPLLVQDLFEVIQRINREKGTSFLLVEQNAVMALSLANYAYVMENGRIVLDGPASELVKNEDIKEFYLGLDAVGERKSYRDVKHYRRRKRWLS
ncbi:MAG: ABC transporter ATP-binding protein, partial [Thermodesulfobacteriota bacterium]